MDRRTVDLEGPVHYADFGGSGRPIVLLHGLGGSHANWLAVAPRLARIGRVLAPDLLGHGRTRSLGRRATVDGNLRLLDGFLDRVAGGPAALVGNSLGGYLAIAFAAAFPARVTSLVLVAPAAPVSPRALLDREVLTLFAGAALPFVGGAVVRWRRRNGPERLVADSLRLVCADPARVEPEVVEAHVELARERFTFGSGVVREFLATERSLVARLTRRGRFREMVRRVRVPALLVQGDEDRIVRLESTRALAAVRPDWRLEVFRGVGHVPQLEAPGPFLAVVEPWLAGAGASPPPTGPPLHSPRAVGSMERTE